VRNDDPRNYSRLLPHLVRSCKKSRFYRRFVPIGLHGQVPGRRTKYATV
jgi:hypothetical protein